MTREKSLKEHLVDELRKYEGQWIKKVALFLVADEQGYSPETAGRELRTLAGDPTSGVQVAYYDGKYAKHLAKYAYNPPPEKRKTVEIIEGKAYLKYV